MIKKTLSGLAFLAAFQSVSASAAEILRRLCRNSSRLPLPGPDVMSTYILVEAGAEKKFRIRQDV